MALARQRVTLIKVKVRRDQFFLKSAFGRKSGLIWSWAAQTFNPLARFDHSIHKLRGWQLIESPKQSRKRSTDRRKSMRGPNVLRKQRALDISINKSMEQRNSVRRPRRSSSTVEGILYTGIWGELQKGSMTLMTTVTLTSKPPEGTENCTHLFDLDFAQL